MMEKPKKEELQAICDSLWKGYVFTVEDNQKTRDEIRKLEFEKQDLTNKIDQIDKVIEKRKEQLAKWEKEQRWREVEWMIFHEYLESHFD